MSEYTKEYRIAQLLAKEMTETLSPEEQQELDTWKNDNSGSRELYTLIRSSENRQNRDKLIQELDAKSSWQDVRKRIHTPRAKRKSLITRIAAIAAVVLLVVGIGSIIFHMDKTSQPTPVMAEVQTGSSKAILITPNGLQITLSKQDSTQTIALGNGLYVTNDGKKVEYTNSQDSNNININQQNVIQVPRGGEYELVLPDNTHVWLNSDTELSFPVKFSTKQRVVTLKGEAYFSVAKNENCPFIVQTSGKLKIEVLGTQFNIQAYPDAKVVETTLSQGSVRVSDGHISIKLKPDQQAIYNNQNQQLHSRDVEARLYCSWKDGLFIFENQPLEEIMSTLSKWYNVNVFYANNNVKKYHFTGDLERYADFTKTLRMIEKATSIHFVVNGNNIMVEETSK